MTINKSLTKVMHIALSIGGIAVGMSSHANESGQYLKSVISREIMETYISDSNELLEQEIQQGITFSHKDDLDTSHYQQLVDEMCREQQVAPCAQVLFTTKENVPVASMYPNGKMLLNFQAVSHLPLNEVSFTIAHEMAHLTKRHSLRKAQYIAKSIVDTGVFVMEVEKILPMAGMLPGMKELLHDIENEADQAAFEYIGKKGITIDCTAMFNRMLQGQNASQDKHPLPADRCHTAAPQNMQEISLKE